ncbi:glycosyltransferase [Oceanicella actignis]|uniref:glycosyltransferase n=1 Tax=Oceanicella actignis TaxID=1189325 RepID=UPI0011E66B56|nr:glycosyltransferase [Oceanicella actignis]TYO89112.1 glycosyltransferase involved in cell wall biosynthesis [Oceanicella actignis]
MKVAVIHYWLVGMRGGERVLERICELFPEADIFTHVCIAQNISQRLRAHRIRETFIARLPGARRAYQRYLPLMPRALEELDLSGYDLVLSSESGPAKGVIAPPDALHLCYCHSPMRYIWDQHHAYRAALGPLGRAVFAAAAPRLRLWDAASAARVDAIAANSRFIQRRIRRCWGREARVIHPPVDLAAYAPGPPEGEAGYLFLSELVPYKRADIAVQAFRALDLPLTVAGDGPERGRLEAMAGPRTRFLGRVPASRMAALYRSCKALIFPGVEDFGIVPLEAMACGRPVIAYRGGGALDTVVEGRTGLFFDEQTPESLAEAVLRFERDHGARMDPDPIRAHAMGFGPERFKSELAAMIADEAARIGARLDPGDLRRRAEAAEGFSTR